MTQLKDLDDVDKINTISSDLSGQLGYKALECSKDSNRDGPFAINGKLACQDAN